MKDTSAVKDMPFVAVCEQPIGKHLKGDPRAEVLALVQVKHSLFGSKMGM